MQLKFEYMIGKYVHMYSINVAIDVQLYVSSLRWSFQPPYLYVYV